MKSAAFPQPPTNEPDIVGLGLGLSLTSYLVGSRDPQTPSLEVWCPFGFLLGCPFERIPQK